MEDESWSDEDEQLFSARADHEGLAGDEFNSPRGEFSKATWSFAEQFESGVWPIKVPFALEIYAEGDKVQFRHCRAGERPLNPGGQVLTLFMQLDRAAVRDMLLDRLREMGDEVPKLSRIIGLARIDRSCFLDTIVAHFVRTLGGPDQRLPDEPRLPGVLHYLNEYDPDIVPDMVAQTIEADRAIGARLRDLILDVISESDVRERLGWLVVAHLTDRLQEL